MDLNGPALAPPAGITSNLDNPPNNNALAIGVFSTCAAIATICFLMRAYARIFLLKKVQIEEGEILFQSLEEVKLTMAFDYRTDIMRICLSALLLAID
ncbi:hypothetical protein N7456_009498 [Penicillium angulare]|uniref:Uncharacterized protein n=1 Tax=Penicillium angulare TaxID=116970 RepID=A0A9W9F526_9EURO|nr:hypothetical protein N7456_009498 [Penicillium angulare]